MTETAGNAIFYIQAIGFLGMLIETLLWQIKNPRHIYAVSVLVTLIWGIHYVFLSAPAAVVYSMISALKYSVMAFVKDERIIPPTVFLTIGSTIFLTLTYYSASYDLVPLFGCLIINMALLKRDNRALFCRAVILGCIGWVYYNAVVGSWFGCLAAALNILSLVIGMYRYEKWNLSISTPNIGFVFFRKLFVIPQI